MSRNIERIFVVGKGGHLCSLRFAGEAYADEEEGELRRCLRQWKDAEHLVDLFLTYRADLQGGFFESKSIEDFLFITEREATELTKRIATAADHLNTEKLAQLFQPLHNHETESPKYQFLKAKGTRSKSLLRLYGLRTRDDVYFITGGAIKLNRRMDDREHLKEELLKMEAARKYLSRYLRHLEKEPAEQSFYEFFALIA